MSRLEQAAAQYASAQRKVYEARREREDYMQYFTMRTGLECTEYNMFSENALKRYEQLEQQQREAYDIMNAALNELKRRAMQLA